MTAVPAPMSVRHPAHRPRKLILLSLLPNAWVATRGPRRGKTLYLTFDDGPHPEHTPALLQLLARHRARATFFLIGELAERHPALVHQIVDAGHAIGNHSFSHWEFGKMGLATQLDEVQRTDRLLAAADGRARHPFRPPSGVLPRPLLLHFIRDRRPVAYWSWDSLDYSGRPAAELVAAARACPPRAGDILLLHDDKDTALRMLLELLPAWQGMGFTFASLPQAAGGGASPAPTDARADPPKIGRRA